MDTNGANHQQNDGPRELEIFSDEQVEEVMESLEYFKGKIEQLQSYCELVNQSKMQVDESFLEQKRKHHEEIEKFQEEINFLRNANIQLMTAKVASAEKRGNFSLATLSCAIDAENAESRIQEMASKVRSVELTLREKEKHISVMEWQIMDLDATIATLQAERDQLALELELRNTHENIVEGHGPLEEIGMVGGEENFHGGHAETEIYRKSKPTNPRRAHSDLWGNGSENLSLRQMLSLSAEWSAKDGPQCMRRPPQRHFSDYVKREIRVRSTDFSRPNATHSLEDFDNLSEVDSGLGLGKLTRTTNFCDILDADEYSNFHVADNRLSFTADSVLEVQGTYTEETGSPLKPLSKKWATFENGLPNGDSQDEEVVETEEKVSQNSGNEVSHGNGMSQPLGENDMQSLGSSTSDFSSAFHSSQDILISSTEEPWVSSTVSVSESAPDCANKRKLSRKEISKSDSCIITSRSSPSDREDMWNFTPDSVVNVSTGEILIPSLVETPPSPSLKKSRPFTSSIEIVLKTPPSKPTSTDSTEDDEGSPKDDVEQSENPRDKNESTYPPQEETTMTPEVPHSVETVILRNKSKDSSWKKHHEKSKSACVTSSLEQNDEEGLGNRHKKSLSDPIKKGDDKRGRRKLMEYQKWQKSGRRGKPPGDLKISDC